MLRVTISHSMMQRVKRRLFGATHRVALALAIVVGLAGLSLGQVNQADPAALILVTNIDGPIGPPVARQISEAIDLGETRNAELIVLRLDTPGGLSTSTREINKSILASGVPVAVFVAPQGARAASAGTYILYASHVAAMAPGTNVGAATPVQMSGAGPPGLPRGAERPPPGLPESGASERKKHGNETEDTPAEGTPETNQGKRANKAVNDAVAQIRSLAELRGRNADWAEMAVRQGASLSAMEAKEAGVVEYVAEDLSTLFAALDGVEVTVGQDVRTLSTTGASIEMLEPSVITQLLGVLSDPNVALLLMTIGFYGLIFELSSPGLGPGIPGVICLVLGLYSLNLLPIDYAGLVLVGLGLALMATEAVTPTFGVLGLGGAVSFAIGAAILIDTDAPQYQISTGVIAGITLMSFLIITLVVGAIFATKRERAHAGTVTMKGQPARVLDWSGEAGHVHTQGELWRARGPRGLLPDETVLIADLDGLTLTVRRNESETST